MGKRKDKKPKEIIISDELRLLHRNPGMSRRDYTDQLYESDYREIPEAVDAEYQTLISDRAEAADHLRTQMRLAGQEYRLKTLMEKAELAGVDITRQRLAIERQLKVIAQKMRKAA